MFGDPGKKVIVSLKKHLNQLQSPKDEEKQKAKTKLSADIFQIYFFLYGDADNDPRTDLINNLVERILNTEDNIFTKLAQNIENFEFEAKKHTAQIMNYIIRRCSKNNVHLYIKQQTDMHTHTNTIIDSLLKGYHDQHLAQNVGSVLQEMAKRSEIAPHLLLEIQVTPNEHSLAIAQQKKQNSNVNNPELKVSEDEQCWDIMDELFILVRKPSFDISSDAYKTLHLLLTRHKKKVSQWLDVNYTRFVLTFNELIQSENYVTQRQFLKLLSDVLMEKLNFSIMIKYIGEKENLKTAMILIKNESKVISHEAFHIFKIFVANPKKTRDIQIILYKNREKLMVFLKSFLVEKTAEDELFANEKEMCIQHLQKMPIPPEIEVHLAKKRDRAKSRAEAEAAAIYAAQTPPPTATNIIKNKNKTHLDVNEKSEKMLSSANDVIMNGNNNESCVDDDVQVCNDVEEEMVDNVVSVEESDVQTTVVVATVSED